MAQRGRKSAASRAVANHSGAALAEKPAAPEGMTVQEAAIWETVTDALPADWFRGETLPMLAMYCAHTASWQRICAEIRRLEGEVQGAEALVKLDDLYKMRDRENRAAQSLATKLRITLQSTYNAENTRKKRGDVQKGPWLVGQPSQ